MPYKKLSDTFALPNGVNIPCIGYGTWQAPDGENFVNIVLKALEAGYRHIDTASAYNNEGSVGEAVKRSSLKREEIFVTSKLWNTERGSEEKVLKAFAKTLKTLQLDYLDLYLIHWTCNEKMFGGKSNELNAVTWKAFEKLYKDGKIRSIGVSNFLVPHLSALLETADIKPMVNQIEYHPGYTQRETVDFCQKNSVVVEAWSPLGSGRSLNISLLQNIGNKYGKTVAQVCLRWCLQTGTLPLPKSMTVSRVVENTQIFDFELSADDVNAISTLPEAGFSGFHPDALDF